MISRTDLVRSHQDRIVYDELQRYLTIIDSFNVKDLKPLCRSLQVACSGRKQALLDAVKLKIGVLVVNEGRDKTVNGFDIVTVAALREIFRRYQTFELLPIFDTVVKAIHDGNDPKIIDGKFMIDIAKRRDKGQNEKTICNNANGRGNGEEIEQQNVILKTFMDTPFYKIVEKIDNAHGLLKPTNNVRNNFKLSFQLNSKHFQMINSNNYKLYLFCGVIEDQDSSGEIGNDGNTNNNNDNIVFPIPCEILFNDNIINDKGIRGMKNKPGTAKPSDLTKYVRYSPLENMFHFLYTNINKKYFIQIALVQIFTPEQLIEKYVLRNPRIIKNATLYYLNKIKRDEERTLGISATSSVMSLQCPISFMKMKYPVKSMKCKHLQCFDALWYLHSQSQIPLWQCPICQIKISIEDLFISEFVQEIIEKCPTNVDSVELSTNGKWEMIYEDEDGQDSDGDGVDEEYTVLDTTMESEKIANGHQNKLVEPKTETESITPLTQILSDRNGNSNKNNNSKKRNDDPIIISLDSDDNDEEEWEEQRGDKHNTLDPKINPLHTPKLDRLNPSHETSFTNNDANNNIDFIPNILGRTPLNHETQMRPSSSSSSSSSSFSIGPQHSDMNATPPYRSLNPAAYESQSNTEPTKTMANPFLQNTSVSSSTTTISEPLPKKRNPFITDNVVESQNKRGSDDENDNEIAPTLPELPNLTSRQSETILSGKGTKGPIVVPFKLRNHHVTKDYTNNLPKKRQLSNASSLFPPNIENNNNEWNNK